ncbi:ATP-grasp domain-containing protein [Streptomyces lavendulocolor]|uniref:ATP-grasp domain-containing protein n=1 Tax=Streptomyces lavendulocolor TaxID=67316 RepID=UPI0033EBA0F0
MSPQPRDPARHPAAEAVDAEAVDAEAAPRLLVVGGANPLPSSLDIVGQALDQATARGMRTHTTHRAEMLARTRAVTRLAGEVSPVDPDSPEETLRWITGRVAGGEGFDLVLGLRDSVQVATALAAEAAGAPGNPPEAVHRVRNKDACRAALAAAGFRQPAVRRCTSAAQAEAFLRESAGPWVVKPPDGSGSVGVRKVTGPGDLPVALDGLPDRDVFLVEEFVDGTEFSAEGVFVGGRPVVLAVTAKETLPPPHFVEVGHVLPADLPEERRLDVEQQVARALTVLGLRFGVFHVELWLTRDGVVLGEVHPRPGGDWLHRLMSYAMPGLELFGLLYDDVLGRPVRRPAVTRAAAVRFLTPPPGRITAVRGWEAVAAHPGVLHAELTAGPGTRVAPIRESGDRAGYVVVGAPTPAGARELARRLAESVEFVVEDVRERAGEVAAGR